MLKPSVSEGQGRHHKQVERGRGEQAAENHDCHWTLNLATGFARAERQRGGSRSRQTEEPPRPCGAAPQNMFASNMFSRIAEVALSGLAIRKDEV